MLHGIWGRRDHNQAGEDEQKVVMLSIWVQGVARYFSTSSLRTQGPIRRAVHDAGGVKGLVEPLPCCIVLPGLWVPAFAGTTDERFCFPLSKHSFAISRRASSEVLLLFPQTLQSEGAGNGRAPMRRGKNARVVAVVTPETPGIPRAMVYTAASCSPRRSGSFATVTCGTYRKLDTSVEMSGRHDLAVRNKHARLARRRVPPQPIPRS